MQLAAVTLARALAFVETFDLNPRGRVFFPDLIREIVQRYRFQKFPQRFEDFDEQKGVEFLEGKLGDFVIDKLVIYSNGILVDTRNTTHTSQDLIEEALAWARSNFGLKYELGMIKRFAYLSQLTFHSEMRLDNLNAALQRLAHGLSSEVSKIHGEEIPYQTSSVILQHDPLLRKNPIAAFTIMPRVETPFSENKYFSEAPVSTDAHIQLLTDFEADVLGKNTAHR